MTETTITNRTITIRTIPPALRGLPPETVKAHVIAELNAELERQKKRYHEWFVEMYG